LKILGGIHWIHYAIPDNESIFGGVIDEEDLKQLKLVTYDAVIVAGCTTNCIDLVKAGLRLLADGQQLYTKSLIRLAMEERVENVDGPSDSNYVLARDIIIDIVNERAILEERVHRHYLNQITNMDNQSQDIHRMEILRLAWIDDMIKLTQKRFINIRNQLVDRLMAKFIQRDQDSVRLVINYLNTLASKLGYLSDRYQFPNGYPDYVILVKSLS
jgi:hypothetical protein